MVLQIVFLGRNVGPLCRWESHETPSKSDNRGTWFVSSTACRIGCCSFWILSWSPAVKSSQFRINFPFLQDMVLCIALVNEIARQTRISNPSPTKYFVAKPITAFLLITKPDLGHYHHVWCTFSLLAAFANWKSCKRGYTFPQIHLQMLCHRTHGDKQTRWGISTKKEILCKVLRKRDNSHTTSVSATICRRPCFDNKFYSTRGLTYGTLYLKLLTEWSKLQGNRTIWAPCSPPRVDIEARHPGCLIYPSCHGCRRAYGRILRTRLVTGLESEFSHLP